MTGLFEVPAYAISRELYSRAQSMGERFAVQSIENSQKQSTMGDQIELLKLTCTHWAVAEVRKLPEPRKYPGFLMTLVGIFIVLNGSTFFDAGVGFVAFAAVALSLTGASVMYSNVLGTKSPSYLRHRRENTNIKLSSIVIASAMRTFTAMTHNQQQPY